MYIFYYLPSGVVALALLLLIPLVIYLGYRFGLHISFKRKPLDEGSFGGLETGLYGLVGLLLAFTFGMAAARYDSRRNVMVQEANAIGTAILRTDLYPDSVRSPMRSLLSEYLEARTRYFRVGANLEKTLTAYADAQATGNQIWAIATRFSKANPSSSADRHMIPALNDMFDLATERHAGLLAKVPVPILWMMIALCLCGAFFNGYSNGLKRRLDWTLTAVFYHLPFISSLTLTSRAEALLHQNKLS
jgi:hypothetical protein